MTSIAEDCIATHNIQVVPGPVSASSCVFYFAPRYAVALLPSLVLRHVIPQARLHRNLEVACAFDKMSRMLRSCLVVVACAFRISEERELAEAGDDRHLEVGS